MRERRACGSARLLLLAHPENGRIAGAGLKAVVESLPGRGMGINPKPGEIQPQDAPHYGITVMIDAGGNARGRIWLPTDLAQTDANGNRWFTHEIQVIADGPSQGSFVWAWEDKGGPPYAPRPCQQTAGGGTGAPGPDVPATGGGGAGPTSPGDMVIDLRPLEARIQALERLVAAQADAIADLKKRPVTFARRGRCRKRSRSRPTTAPMSPRKRTAG